MKLTLLILFKFFYLFAPANTAVPASIYDVKVAAHKGDDIDFSAFKGKKILIVNVPENAAYEPQYAELDALYKKYQDKLVIIGFLAEDFAVMPGSKKSDNRQTNYKVSFPLAAKVGIKGTSRAPIYKWLTEKKYNKLKDSEVKWDFQKYLVNEQGELVAVFDPKVKPSSPLIAAAIEK